MSDRLIEKDPFARAFGSVESLADTIKDILDCPVTIEDANHRLLAYSSHDDETDSARIATIIKRRVPENVINQLWKTGIIPKLVQNENPVRIQEMDEIGLGNRVAVSIRRNKEILGYIWVVEGEKRLSDDQLTILKNAAKAARTELLKLNAVKKKNDEDYQDFFWKLLTGHTYSENQIIEKFEKLNIKFPSQFAVLVFKFEDKIIPQIENKINYLITTSQKVTNTFYVLMQNELIIMASPTQPPFTKRILTEFIHYFIVEMKNRFDVEHVQGSSGTIYDNFDKVERSYQEALKVIRLRERFPEETNDIYHYQQLGVFRYLDTILEKRREDTFEHPVISKLRKYDKMNRANLLETIEVYISNDSNLNEAAKKLFIHTNTLNYRLKRIYEITEIDLKNMNEKMSLYLDLKLMRLEEKNRL
ncbi:MAG: PucR family transcriptional regulator [Bacillota bacterium]